jgi:hypothetical protein
MAKKRAVAATKPSNALLTKVQKIIDLVHENKNWFYIAVIGFCLSVTILYNLGRLWGWWTA